MYIAYFIICYETTVKQVIAENAWKWYSNSTKLVDTSSARLCAGRFLRRIPSRLQSPKKSSSLSWTNVQQVLDGRPWAPHIFLAASRTYHVSPASWLHIRSPAPGGVLWIRWQLAVATWGRPFLLANSASRPERRDRWKQPSIARFHLHGLKKHFHGRL